MSRAVRRSLVSLLCLFALTVLPRVAAADTLRGRVVDPHGRPVAGANVMIVRAGSVVATTRSGADGAYGPVTLSPGEYEIVAGAPGLRTAAAERVRISAGSETTATLTLVVAAIGDSVVVSASHVETPLSRATDAVTLVDRRTLDQLQVTQAADALRLVPGFSMTQSGGPGALASIFPRGGESDYTLVLVDGVAQNTFGGAFDAAHLAAGDLDRLEIVRGPQSALHGGGAIGGIVHAITRHGGPLRADATVETGSYGSTRVEAGAGGSAAGWTFAGRVDRLATDGDTRHMPSIGTEVDNADYQRTAASGSLAWSDRPSRRVRIDLRGGRNERGTPGPYGSDPVGLYDGLDLVSRGENRFFSVSGSALFRQGARLTHRGQVSRASFRGHFLSPFGESDDDTRRVAGRYQVDLAARVPVSAGMELQHERADNTFVTDSGFEPTPVERTIAGWFVEARPVVANRVFLALGARLERIARAPLDADPFGARPVFQDSDIVWSANPKVSVAWIARSGDGEFLGWTRLRGGAGTGIKPPSTFDIAFTDNPALKPERSRSVDAGIEQALAGGAAVLEATIFANHYDDLIVAVPAELRDRGISRHRTDNISNARARGLELGATWRVAAGLTVRGGWTWLDTEILDLDQAPGAVPLPYAVGSRLVRRPAAQGSLALTWSGERADAFVMVNGRGAVLDLEPNLGANVCFGLDSSCRAVFDNPGYAVTDVGATLRLRDGVTVIGRVTNLFDRAYEEVLGFPALGRSAMIGLRVAAGR